MAFQVTCPCCGNTGSAPGNFLGKPIRCKRCQTKFLVLDAPADVLHRRSRWPIFHEDMPPLLVEAPSAAPV